MLQVRVGKRSPQAALRIAVDMAEDPAFPLTAGRGRRARAPRCSPIRRRTPCAAERLRLPLVDGPAGVARASPAARSSLTPEAAVAVADAGRDRDPRPRRDLARRRPRHGPGGRDPDVPRRPREPRGGGRARLGDPGGRRRVPIVVDRRTGWSSAAGRSLAGDVITIDGGTGEVFEGVAAGVGGGRARGDGLLGVGAGARDPDRRRRAAERPQPSSPAAPPARGRPAGAWRSAMLAVKGNATPDTLAVAMGVPVDVATAADRRPRGRRPGRAVRGRRPPHRRGSRGRRGAGRRGSCRLGPGRRGRGARRVRHPRPADEAGRHRLAAARGRAVFNDHADAAYDAAVLARLGGLHRDVEGWLASASAGLPRLALYGVRLSAAAAQVASGNGKYIASPRVDSYHGTWFELHEDLIGLAGRTRAEETAAGRA